MRGFYSSLLLYVDHPVELLLSWTSRSLRVQLLPLIVIDVAVALLGLE